MTVSGPQPGIPGGVRRRSWIRWQTPHRRRLRIHRRRDGSYFPVEVSVARIDIDGAAYVFGVVRDITERKQMEAVQRSLAQRMLETLEAERQRVAGELHDDVGQAVASVGDLIRSLEQASGAVPDEARPALAATNSMIREITASVARIVRTITRPT